MSLEIIFAKGNCLRRISRLHYLFVFLLVCTLKGYSQEIVQPQSLLNFISSYGEEDGQHGFNTKEHLVWGSVAQKQTMSFEADTEEHHRPDGKYLSEAIDQSSNVSGENEVKSGIEETIKPKDKLLPVEKPWREIKHTQDAYKYNCNTTMDWLWDGKPGRYPRVFHTAKGSTMPHTFTFDLGRIYTNLVQMEQWGRMDPRDRPFSNPIHFEVWGIEGDITNAIPDLPADAPNWKDATINKGWTLLADVVRKDNGIDGIKIDLIKNAPPVRFIRIRVLETIDQNAQGMSHMSELSFWYAK